MQIIHLNANSFAMFPRVAMVQNDTGRELKMVLDDMTLSGSETGAVAIHRSDGSYYTIPATRVVGDNAFTADMSQALTQPRQTECQLKVTASDDTVISTYTFIIMVQPSTDGISEEQLGYSVQQLRQDAIDIRTGGMPADLRMALLQIAQKVAYIDENGAQYYQDLYDALAPSAILTGITAIYTQSGTVYDTDSLDDLKADLVVTASYSDGTTETLPASVYTLSGTLEAGASTVTVSYETATTTFSVIVTSATQKPDFLARVAVTSANGQVPYIEVTQTDGPRGACVCLTGSHKIRLNSSTSSTFSDYYPIEIPNDAIGVKITSDSMDCGCVELYYNATDWIRETSAGWMLKTSGVVHQYLFTGSQRTHIVMPFREAGKTSGGTVTQAMMNAVGFEWIRTGT